MSRDVLFHESLVPFHSVTNFYDISYLFLDLVLPMPASFSDISRSTITFLFPFLRLLLLNPLFCVISLGFLTHLLIFVIIIVIFFIDLSCLFLVTILYKIIFLILFFSPALIGDFVLCKMVCLCAQVHSSPQVI